MYKCFENYRAECTYYFFFCLCFFFLHHQKQHDVCLKTDQHLITTYWHHLIEMANTNRKMIIETFEEKLHAKDTMHFRNLGLIFFQESILRVLFPILTVFHPCHHLLYQNEPSLTFLHNQ